MKKKLTYLIAFLMIALINVKCSKKNFREQDPNTVGAEWMMPDGTKYLTTQTPTTYHNGYLFETKDGNASIQVFFGSDIPEKVGTYKIVNEEKAANHTLAADEVAFEVNVGTDDVYTTNEFYDTVTEFTPTLDLITNDNGELQIYTGGHNNDGIGIGIKVNHYKDGTLLNTNSSEDIAGITMTFPK